MCSAHCRVEMVHGVLCKQTAHESNKCTNSRANTAIGVSNVVLGQLVRVNFKGYSATTAREHIRNNCRWRWVATTRKISFRSQHSCKTWYKWCTSQKRFSTRNRRTCENFRESVIFHFNRTQAVCPLMSSNWTINNELFSGQSLKYTSYTIEWNLMCMQFGYKHNPSKSILISSNTMIERADTG